jgi:hypothetical protein
MEFRDSLRETQISLHETPISLHETPISYFNWQSLYRVLLFDFCRFSYVDTLQKDLPVLSCLLLQLL